jgi:Zn-dependent M32 family carboxypeptidase
MFNPAHVLRDQMDAERVCQERLREIAKSELLTAEERAGVLAQADEEILHEQAFEACLETYGGREAGEAGRQTVHSLIEAGRAELSEPALRVADFRVVERFMRPVMKSAREMFRAIGDAKAIAAYDMILADEESHVEFNRTLFNRLKAVLPGLFERWSSLRSNHYSKPLFRRAMRGSH